MGWYDAVREIDPFDDLDLDADLIAGFESAASGLPARPIRFHTPTFKEYATEEVQGCGKNSFPAFSITGGACALDCDHCQAKILEPMIPATRPEDLDRKVRDLIVLQDLKGFLLSGGSNRRNEVPYERFYPVVEKLKRDFPQLKVATHSALLDETRAKRMEAAGVDVAMMDLIGAQDTIEQVYHLDRPVEDFEATLAALRTTRMDVVPHIVIGLHYGQVLGEYNALKMVARHDVDALVLVVVMPFYAPADKAFATVPTREVAAVFQAARAQLPDVAVQLGCARPAGQHKMITDAYAVMAGLDGIAFPAEGIKAVAETVGRPVDQQHACCSMVIDGLPAKNACAA